jgi:hypothetical protein
MCASTLTCVFIDIDMSGCLYFTVPQYTSVLVYCTASEGYDGILRPSLLLQRSAKFRGQNSVVLPYFFSFSAFHAALSRTAQQKRVMPHTHNGFHGADSMQNLQVTLKK